MLWLNACGKDVTDWLSVETSFGTFASVIWVIIEWSDFETLCTPDVIMSVTLVWGVG